MKRIILAVVCVLSASVGAEHGTDDRKGALACAQHRPGP